MEMGPTSTKLYHWLPSTLVVLTRIMSFSTGLSFISAPTFQSKLAYPLATWKVKIIYRLFDVQVVRNQLSTWFIYATHTPDSSPTVKFSGSDIVCGIRSAGEINLCFDLGDLKAETGLVGNFFLTLSKPCNRSSGCYRSLQTAECVSSGRRT